LVFITIIPDEQGRFGFNVKGGIDQKLPIIVSRVGSNTPADRCYPKLNEGDQVVLINGRDVSTHTHDQVVNFIRASSEPHSGQLTLAVRQNVYLGDEVAEEPDFEYVPESSLVGGLGTSLAAGGASHPNVSMTSTCSSLNIVGQGGQTAALSQSMMLLDESLTSGAIIGQFEQLYRRNLGLSMTICHMQENMAKKSVSGYLAVRCYTGRTERVPVGSLYQRKSRHHDHSRIRNSQQVYCNARPIGFHVY
jgi:tyrosine-protein phosphatase non-receptor type 4